MTRGAKRRRSASMLNTLDDFLAEEGKRDEFEAVAVKEVLAWADQRGDEGEQALPE